MPDPVITDIASAIHVRHILTPINVVRRFTRNDRVQIVRAHLEGNLFDFTPIFPSTAVEPDESAAGSPGPDAILSRVDLAQAHADDRLSVSCIPFRVTY